MQQTLNNKIMDAYQKFKNEIDGILDDLDCLLYVLDEQTEENHTNSIKNKETILWN